MTTKGARPKGIRDLANDAERVTKDDDEKGGGWQTMTGRWTKGAANDGWWPKGLAHDEKGICKIETSIVQII